MDAKGRRLLRVGLGALAAGWLLLLAFIAHDRLSLRNADAFQTVTMEPQKDGSLPVLWPAPPFSGVDQHGRATTGETLAGHVWIADFIFTRCTTACPLISAKLLFVRNAITRPGVRFVSFSVDPEHDTPTVLEQYAERWSGDPRWFLLNTHGKDVHDIAKGMRVPIERSSDPVNPILHTTFFFLVDSSGRVRGIYDSLDDQAVGRLIHDAERLDGASGAALQATFATAPGSSSVDRGRALFDTVGCSACHTDVRVAPPLGGLWSRTVHLEDGGTALADEAYVRESILDPGARIVAGYGTLMPSYREHLSGEQVSDVVDYLRSMPAPSGPLAPEPAPAALTQAIDPVCGMKVVATERSAHVSYLGRVYYFCSDTCLERFSKAPRKYLPGGS